jgi:uncharacterized membrane protein
MERASIILGFTVLIGTVLGLIPFLSMLNWINIPLAVIGLIITIIASSQTVEEGKKAFRKINYIFVAAIIIGVIRLIIGAGFI